MASGRTRHVFRTLAGLAVLGTERLIHAAYQRDIRAARERVATGSQMARTPCGPIEDAILGEGPPVLIVHGAGGGMTKAWALVNR